MTKYLQMDGVDDTLKAPATFAFNKVVMDFVAYPTKTWQYFFDARYGGLANSYFAVSNITGNIDEFGSVLTVYKNGVPQTNHTSIVVSGVRAIYELVSSIVATNTAGGRRDLLGGGTSFAGLQANVYDVKFYNGDTLVAWYDMSTGTVQDQSGNGNDATLTGGTWLDDGTGGTPTGTTYTGEGTSQGYASASAVEHAILQALGITQGYSDLTTAETFIEHTGTSYSGAGTAQGISDIQGNAFFILAGSGISTGQSSLLSVETVTHDGASIYPEGGVIQGNTLFTTKEIVSFLTSGLAEGYSLLDTSETGPIAIWKSVNFTTVQMVDDIKNSVNNWETPDIQTTPFR